MLGSFGFAIGQDSPNAASDAPATSEPAVAAPAGQPAEEKAKKVKPEKEAKEKKVKEEKAPKEKKVKEAKAPKEKKVKEAKPPKVEGENKRTDNIVKGVGVALIGVAVWLFFSPAK